MRRKLNVFPPVGLVSKMPFSGVFGTSHVYILSVCVLIFGWVIHLPLAAQQYTDVAQSKGIQHHFGLGDFGGGVSFYDFNGDGWDDLTFGTAHGDSVYFYVNQGGNFQKISPCPIDFTGEAKQILWADIDNDGDADLFVAGHLSGSHLYENTGNLTLVDITAAAGLDTTAMPTYGASLVDADKDGLLDLYIVNRTLGGFYSPNRNYFYRNLGNLTFQDVTLSIGVADSNKAPFCSSFFDMNNDGWEDLFIAHDKHFYRNVLLKNTGNGFFQDISAAAGVDRQMDGMCVAIGDINQDNYLDVYVTNTLGGNSLYLNQGNETFVDTAAGSGVGVFGTSAWGANFLDYDNDLDLDLYMSSEYIGIAPEPSKLFVNDGTGNFSHPAGLGFVGDTGRSFSNALGDLNNDGWVDIAVSNFDQELSQVWQNSGGNLHWLKVELEGSQSNRDAIGSRIEYWVGGKRYLRTTHCGMGYLAQNSGVEILGMGTFSQVDTLLIYWPNGSLERFYGLCVDQKVKIVEGAGQVPSPQIVAQEGLRLCGGDTLTLDAGIFAQYQWSTGDTTRYIEVTSTGDYEVRVLDQMGLCANAIPITVIDTFGGTLAICEDKTVYLDTAGTASLTVAEVYAGTLDPCRSLAVSLSQTQFSCAEIGTQTVKLYISEAGAPVDSCSAVISVWDTLAPVASCKNMTVHLDAAGNGTLTAALADDGSVDACGVANRTISNGTFSCADAGSVFADTLKVIDGSGNSDECLFSITVEDTVAPQAICQDVTVFLDGNGEATIGPQLLDGGSSDVCGIGQWLVSDSVFTCAQVGQEMCQLKVVDQHGNVDSCQSQVEVLDTIHPAAICNDVTLWLDVTGEQRLTVADVDAGSSDACGLQSLHVDESTLSCADLGNVVRVLTVTDESGNIAKCSAEITVIDSFPPVVYCRNHTVFLDADGMGSLTANEVIYGSPDDNCTLFPQMSVTPNQFTITDTGWQVVTVLVTDDVGNSATCLADVWIADTLQSSTHRSTSFAPGNITIWPNPFLDYLSIQAERGVFRPAEAVKVTLLDVAGRRVWSQEVQLSGGELKWTLPVEGLNGGVYILLLEQQDRRYPFRLVH